MVWALTFLQIKTYRSAWMFLVFSVFMFLYGAYHFYFSEPITNAFSRGFSVIWLLATGSYAALAAWALVSEKGKTFLSNQEKIETPGKRSLLWFLKFLFGCAAAAFATLMLISVMAMPFLGPGSFEKIIFADSSLWYEFFIGLLYAPIIYRTLK